MTFRTLRSHNLAMKLFLPSLSLSLCLLPFPFSFLHLTTGLISESKAVYWLQLLFHNLPPKGHWRQAACLAFIRFLNDFGWMFFFNYMVMAIIFLAVGYGNYLHDFINPMERKLSALWMEFNAPKITLTIIFLKQKN